MNHLVNDGRLFSVKVLSLVFFKDLLIKLENIVSLQKFESEDKWKIFSEILKKKKITRKQKFKKPL